MSNIVRRLIPQAWPLPARARHGMLFSGCLLSLSLLAPARAGGEEPPVSVYTGSVPQAPPPAPPVLVQPATNTVANDTPRKWDLNPVLYSIGQPTDEEQLYLEYINRSRANPPAEGARLAAVTDPDVLSAYNKFAVDLGLLQSQFNAISSVPPLAMNAQLLTSARLHSGDMYTNQFQGHDGSNGSNLGQRASAQGYPWTMLAENVYSYAKSVWYGHVGFNVDWGYGTGGMQTPPGHRDNIHNGSLREVGVGVVNGVNGSVGPQLVTQDFGTQPSGRPFICGVVYYDLSTNAFYDLGEGIGGVTVLVNGATNYAITANSGGYAVPVTTNGTYTVAFLANGLASTQQVVIVSGRNAKADFVPPYTPPVVSGPNPAGLNQANAYTISTVGGATNYQWLQAQLSAYTTVDGGENGATNVTATVSPGYAVLTTDTKAAGSYSYHLAHPVPTGQYLQLKPMLRPAANSQLTFAKRLGWASPLQVAKAQVSVDGGGSWRDLWSQAGTSTSGDTSFSRVTNSLSAYAGQVLQVRFAYLFSSGNYYPGTNSGVGFYLDEIAVSNADRLVNAVTNSAPGGGTLFSFSPGSLGNYLLAARVQLPGRTLSWGPFAQVAVIAPTPSIQLQGLTALAGNQVQVDFTVSNYRTGMTFQLWKAGLPAGAWTADAGASFQTLVAGSKYRATATRSATNGFYRIQGSY